MTNPNTALTRDDLYVRTAVTYKVGVNPSHNPQLSLPQPCPSTHLKPFPTAAPGSAWPCPLHPRGSSGPGPQRAKGKEQSPDVNYWKRIKPVSPERGTHRPRAPPTDPTAPPAATARAELFSERDPPGRAAGSGARRGRPAPVPPGAELVSARLSPRRCARKHRGAEAGSGRDAQRTARSHPSGAGSGRAGAAGKRRRPRAWRTGRESSREASGGGTGRAVTAAAAGILPFPLPAGIAARGPLSASPPAPQRATLPRGRPRRVPTRGRVSPPFAAPLGPDHFLAAATGPPGGEGGGGGGTKRPEAAGAPPPSHRPPAERRGGPGPRG